MKLRKLGLLMTFVLVTIAMSSYGVFAADTNWVTPATDAIGLTGSAYNLSVAVTALDDISNVTLEYKTASGSWTYITTAENSSDNTTSLSATWDTTAITDQAGVSLNASSYSGSTAIGWTLVSSNGTFVNFDIDNTNPTTSYGSTTPSSGFTSDNSSLTIDTATDASIINCTLYASPSFNNSVTQYFTTASGSRCVYQIDGIIDNSFSYNWETVDNLNTSNSSVRYVSIDLTRGGVYIPPKDKITAVEKAKTNTKTIVVFAAAILLMYFIWKKK